MPKARSYHILDWSEVRLMQILILIGSVLVFPAYAILLIYCRTIFIGILLYIVFISLQVPLGLVLTRYFQGLGARVKRKLKILDSSSLGGDWDSSLQEMHSEEVTRLFDNIIAQLQKYDPSVDDVIDLTWFGVIVWAVLSTGIVAVFDPPLLFYVTPSLILAGLCMVILYNGYRVAGTISFEESLEHLKHLVLSRLASLQTVADKRYFQPGVKWLSKGKKQALADIAIQILNKSREDGSVIWYWLGLPSTDDERLVFDVPMELVNPIQEALADIPLLSDLGWIVETASNNNELGVVLRNIRNDLRFDILSTIIHSPSRIKETSEKLAEALTISFQAL